MFAKSKRFPAAEKNDMPGPGEYNVNGDDANRHKRYGFLSQSDRFLEASRLEHPEDDGYSTSTISSDITPKKELCKSTQKEYDMLVAKSKRMEITLQTLENEKKIMKMDNNMELAKIRSKNAALEKTIARQEKQIKANSWQKRVEQLEQDYEKKLSEKECQMAVLRQELLNKTTDLEETRNAHLQQMKRASNQLQEANERIELLQEDLSQMTCRVSDYERMHAEDAAQIHVQQQEITTLHHHVQRDQESLEDLNVQLDNRDKTIAHHSDKLSLQQSLIHALQTQFQLYRKHMNEVAREQRETKCQGHRKELNQLLTELSKAKQFINNQAININHLKSDIYWLNSRCEQTELVIKEMRQDRSDEFRFYQSLQPYTTFSEKTHENRNRQNSLLLEPTKG